jgi:DnaJ like chaperone protein
MIWGKIIGALAGFKVGGPLGALVGALVGHWVDTHVFGGGKARATFGRSTFGWGAAERMRRAQERQAVFSTSVVNLAAKLAKVDGTVRREEIEAFKAQFAIPPGQVAAVAAIYDQAKQSADGYEPHARRLAEAFSDEPLLLIEVLNALHRIALADGRLHPAEQEFLQRVAVIFGLAGRPFAEDRPADDSPYEVLGVAREASSGEIKTAWRKLTREHHPDTLMAKGMPKEYIDLATKKMAEINAAYDRIRAERGEV